MQVLPGIRLLARDVPKLAKVLPEIRARLAAAGDLSSLVEMAEAATDEGNHVEAVRLLRQASEKSAEQSGLVMINQ